MQGLPDNYRFLLKRFIGLKGDRLRLPDQFYNNAEAPVSAAGFLC